LGGETFYLYALLQVGDRLEQIPLTGGGLTQAQVREAIEAALRRQTPGFLKTVGIVTPTPQLSPELAFQYQMRGMQPPPPRPEFQQVRTQLQQEYRVQPVSLEGAARIPSDVDVLLVLKPKNLSRRAVFAIDQYLMRGGRLIVCAGSHETNFGGEGVSVTPVTTGLDEWFDHLGVLVPPELVLDDQNQALPIPELRQTPLGLLRTWRMAPYPYLVRVTEKGLEKSTLGSGLEAIGIYWGNPVRVDSAKTHRFKVTEVVRSSERSWTSGDLSRVQFVDYQVPDQGTRPQPLAVTLEGKFRSYFAGQAAPSADGDTVAAAEVVLEESPETRMLVVGNSEFLSDFVAQALGRAEGGFFAENLRFVENAIDWMSLDSDMIAIRSRASSARRLKPVPQAMRVTLEASNYIAPPLLLLILGGVHWARRRRVTPRFGARTEPRPLAAVEAS
jgi:ABC-2 type transport system permease protein